MPHNPFLYAEKEAFGIVVAEAAEAPPRFGANKSQRSIGILIVELRQGRGPRRCGWDGKRGNRDARQCTQQRAA